MLILLNILIYFYIIFRSYINKFYILIIFLSLVLMYELIDPIIILYNIETDINLITIIIYQFDGYLLSLALFQLLIYYSFLFFQNKNKNYKITQDFIVSPKLIYSFILFVLFCGIISFATKAGENRLLDYLGQDVQVTPFYSYGCIFIPVLAFLGIDFLGREKKRLMTLLLLSFFPLAYQIFLSSRRQNFIPLIGALLIALIYREDLKKKWIYILLIAFLASLFLGAQFLVRDQLATAEATSDSLLDASIIAQLGEFISVGSTSLASWDQYVINSSPTTHGFHLFYIFLNCMPYLKLGNYFYPMYGNELYQAYFALAPVGALSFVADSILAFGFIGFPLLGIALGFAISWSHIILRIYLSHGLLITEKSLYALSLICIILFKYRSGVGDAMLSGVNFTILYWFIVYFSSISTPRKIPF